MIVSIITERGELLKGKLSQRLRVEILNGMLKPGDRIIEGKWAADIGVSQTTVREAINILAHAGFVTKAPGRSARVVNMSGSDVFQIYELRGAIEGLAARLAAKSLGDVSLLQETMDEMRKAVKTGDREGLIDRDLHFHLILCDLSRNPCVIEHSRRILVPLFDFVRIRASANGQSTSVWEGHLEAHQRIIDLIREREGDVVEQYVKSVMELFAKATQNLWEKREVHAR